MRRRLLATLVALALALVGCLSVVLYVRGADERAMAGQRAVQVLVANQRIPAGTTVAQIRRGGYTDQVTMPGGHVPADAMGVLDAALDTLAVTAEVQPRQLLLRGNLGESTQTSGGLAVPDGKIAVSVEITPTGRVAGFVRPGAMVAVFDTYQVAGTARTATKVLLPRVEVIAVGERGTEGAATTTSGTAQATGAGRPILITVAVSQDEAQRLVHGAQTGKLSLALLDDTATVLPGSGVDDQTLFR